MKNWCLHILLIMLCVTFCAAQDTIVLLDGNKLAVKNVDTAGVVFFEYSNDTGNNFHTMGYHDFKLIKYSNGFISTNKYWMHDLKNSEKNLKNEEHYKKFVNSFRNDHMFFVFYNDPFQGAFSEIGNIGLEIGLFKIFAIGGNYATVIPIGLFNPNPLSGSQADNPGTVFYGNTYRVNLKAYPIKNKTWYAEAQFLYKKISYNGMQFLDEEGDEALTTFTRDERTIVRGIDLLFGQELHVARSPLSLDYFIGFGMRYKWRNLNTYDISGALNENLTQGYSYQYQEMLTPEIGLRIGLGYFMK